ncbi:MAG TPA: hypothetical protein VFK02_34585 [Kofleriaceae bacterium]|nr:hypothetical protein [Kofleriaceae bacterium]
MQISRGPAAVLAALLAAGVPALPGRVHADPVADPRIENADRLFAEGRALLESNLNEACKKFKESLDENPAAIGTLLNVALCDERLGHLASALLRFTDARDRAKEQGLTEHVRAAEEHIQAISPSVPHLTIRLAEQLPGTKVLIDDAVVAPDKLGSIAVDPGERAIVVSAPDRLPYRTQVVLAPAERKDVVVPPLAASVTVRSSRRLIGQIAAVVGGLAAGTGLGIGLYANHLYDQQFGHAHPGDGLCDAATGTCEPRGQARTQRAQTLGNVGTVVGLAGLAVASVGAYLWIRSPGSTDGNAASLAIVPELGADGLGLAATGRF